MAEKDLLKRIEELEKENNKLRKENEKLKEINSSLSQRKLVFKIKLMEWGAVLIKQIRML